jgi:hypothetical protein
MKKKIIAFILLVSLTSIANAREKRGKIVVLDTGLGLHQVNKPYICKGFKQPLAWNLKSDIHYQHGPNIIGLIGSRIDSKRFCILSLNIYNDDLKSRGYITALFKTTRLNNVVAVNLSLNGKGYIALEHVFISMLLKKNIKVIVSSGNEGKLLTRLNCPHFPVCLKSFYLNDENFIVVKSSTGDYSNYSNFIPMKSEDGTDRGQPPMTGTSQATGVFTGSLFKH